MTIFDIVILLLLAIILYFVLKVGIVVLFVVLIIMVIYYLFAALTGTNNTNNTYSTYSTYSTEQFQNVPYPIHPYIKRPNEIVQTNQDWYIPVQKYFDISVNGYPDDETKICMTPSKISEYCVHKRLQENGDLECAIENCSIPGSISGNAAF